MSKQSRGEFRGYVPLTPDEVFTVLLMLAYEHDVNSVSQWLDLPKRDIWKHLKSARCKLELRGIPA